MHDQFLGWVSLAIFVATVLVGVRKRINLGILAIAVSFLFGFFVFVDGSSISSAASRAESILDLFPFKIFWMTLSVSLMLNTAKSLYLFRPMPVQLTKKTRKGASVMLLFFFISLFTSVIGSICGIGGGVIIKPVLDMFGAASVSTISFLSGCTVLSMSCYSIGKSILSREKGLDTRSVTPLAIGAALGGVAGKYVFNLLGDILPSQNTLGMVQAAGLLAVTLGTFIYTVYKGRIKTRHIKSPAAGSAIGALLGISSSFLGIGGGPINIVVLSYFFGMDTKTAALSSIYVILFSQAASLLLTIFGRTVPEFSAMALILMVIGGVGGAILGRQLNRKLDSRMVDKLFLGVMLLIIGICVYNVCIYSA